MSNSTEETLHFAGEEIADLAQSYGMTIGFEMIGMGQVGSVIEALTTLAEIVATDNKRSKLEQESAQLLLEDMIGHLTANH